MAPRPYDILRKIEALGPSEQERRALINLVQSHVEKHSSAFLDAAAAIRMGSTTPREGFQFLLGQVAIPPKRNETMEAKY